MRISRRSFENNKDWLNHPEVRFCIVQPIYWGSQTYDIVDIGSDRAKAKNALIHYNDAKIVSKDVILKAKIVEVL